MLEDYITDMYKDISQIDKKVNLINFKIKYGYQLTKEELFFYNYFPCFTLATVRRLIKRNDKKYEEKNR